MTERAAWPAVAAPRQWPSHSPAADGALLFGVFFMLALAAIVVARQPGTVAVIWLANGAATACIVTAPRERTLFLLAVVALANLAANLAYGDRLLTTLAFLPANTGEVALGVLLTRGFAARYADDHRSFLQVLLRGAVLPPLLGATLGSLALHLLEFGRFDRVWVDWYVGSVLGTVVTLSLGLSLRRLGREGLAQLARPRGLLLLAATVALVVAAFEWLPFPFVWTAAWLAALGYLVPRLLAFANTFVAVCAVAVLIAWGEFRPGEAGTAREAATYLSMLAVVLPAMVAAVMVARQRALGEMLAAVGSRTDSLVVFIDTAGICRWANRAREQYWGTPNEQILGRSWAEVMGEPRYGLRIKPLLERALAGDTVHLRSEVDYPLRGTRTMDVSMQPALDEDGRQIGVLSCAYDVTELEGARRELLRNMQQLRASNESLDQFVRIASHDLREPMNTIAQFVGLIEQSQLDRLDERGQLYFGHVRQGARRMKTMLDDVLQFVRLEGEEPGRREPIDLDALAADARQSLQARLHDSQALFEVAGPLGSVWGWRGLVLLVLQNLVSNAVKFVPPDRLPEVRLSVQREPGMVRLTVSDNGIGIERERLAELGTPFRRLHARRRFEGTGLGLAICKRIAEQHGGAIEIESTPGQGSRFTLKLPQRAVARG